jgi:SAM-dependent methyltransferase
VHYSAQYGQQWAEDYDRTEADMDEGWTAGCVARLLQLADGRPVLEVAAGTGRVAIELARAGLAVSATDISPAMLGVLQRKDGAGLVHARLESMDSITGGPYGLIANLNNSLMMLLSAAEQQAALASAAAALAPDGLLVVELYQLPAEEGSTREREFEPEPGFSWTSRSTVANGIITMRDRMADGEVRVTRIRPVPVAELEQLAAAAGLALVRHESGWSGVEWHGEELTGSLVSIWRRN